MGVPNIQPGIIKKKPDRQDESRHLQVVLDIQEVKTEEKTSLRTRMAQKYRAFVDRLTDPHSGDVYFNNYLIERSVINSILTGQDGDAVRMRAIQSVYGDKYEGKKKRRSKV